MTQSSLPGLLLALSGLLFTACASSRPPVTGAEAAATLPPPHSSFAALVRSLEVIDAVRDPAGYVEVRSVECDSLRDRDNGRDYVRVLLDVTVFSREAHEARRILEELVLALQSEARAIERLDGVLPQRAERVFEEMDWTAAAVPDGPGFSSWVSLSDTVRIEVRPGHHAPATREALAQATSVEVGESLPPLQYVRDLAAREAVAIGEVDTQADVIRLPNRGRDLRVDIRPADFEAHYERGQIGGFLYSIEANSPLARLTHVTIEKAAHLPVASRQDNWTFRAVMTLRSGS